MTFPLNGVSLHWFNALISQTRVGDIAGSFVRSIGLAAIVAVVTVVLSVLAGLAFRRRFRGSAFVFYLADRQPDHARPVRRASASRSPSGCSGCRPTGAPRRSAPSSPGRCRSAF